MRLVYAFSALLSFVSMCSLGLAVPLEMYPSNDGNPYALLALRSPEPSSELMSSSTLSPRDGTSFLKRSKWSIILKTVTMAYDRAIQMIHAGVVVSSTKVLDYVLEEARFDASISTPTKQWYSVDYGSFKLIFISKYEISWDDLTALIQALKAEGVDKMGVMYEVSSISGVYR